MRRSSREADDAEKVAETSAEFAKVLEEVSTGEEFSAYRSRSLELKDRVSARNEAPIVEEAARLRREASRRMSELARPRGRALRLRTIARVGALFGALLGIAAGAGAIWFGSLLPPWLVWAGGLIGVAVTIGSAVAWRRSTLRYEGLSAEETYLSRLASIEVRENLQTAVSAAYSSAIAEVLSESGLLDFPRVAPRLVELAVETIVPVSSIERVERFIFDHPTSAIGITGPRGVGKSTLLQAVCDRVRQRGGEAVLIPAPVEHDARDLLRSIAVALRGDHVQAAHKRLAYQERRLRLRRRWTELIAATVLLYVGAGLILAGLYWDGSTALDWLGEYWPIFPGIAVAALGLVLLARTYRNRPTLSRLLDRRTSDQILDEVIESMTFEVSAGSTVGATLGSGSLEVTGERTTNKTTRDVSHAQLASALRDALRWKGNESSGPFLLAIDELDKLPSRSALLGTVNAIKDLLHIRNVHVAVSLSDEALEAFELREMSERDAFDSTFDTIIDVDRLSATDAIAVLDSRVTGFPAPLALLCFVWAGGLPRDLLRHARACVEYVKSLQDVPAWHVVAVGVTEGEAERKIQAAMRAGSPASGLHDLKVLLSKWSIRPPSSADIVLADSLDQQTRRLYEYVALRYAAIWAIQAAGENRDADEILEQLRNAVVMTAMSQTVDAIAALIDSVAQRAIVTPVR